MVIDIKPFFALIYLSVIRFIRIIRVQVPFQFNSS